MDLSDWENYHQLIDQINKKIEKQHKVLSPFVALTLTDDPKIQMQSAKIWVDDNCPANKLLPNISKYPKHHKIRIGYFSADFGEHPVSYLTAELFELHNREKFEIIAFSFGNHPNSTIRQRLELGFNQFIDVNDKSDKEITTLAREMQIDIAVDLGGHTRDARTSIFAMRVAPIQISYIGYLGTMGADYFDYLVADMTLIPKDKQQYYFEKIMYLPSYQVNDTKCEISEKIFTRDELGLPSTGFIFCCFNNNYKITPSTFDGWMRILHSVNGSVLWLLDANDTATKNLKAEAISRGIDGNRILFGKRLPVPEYLARYRTADLFLDTFPYNAGTTGSDALRVGLPVLTLIGDSFASRIASSLLNAVGLSELIATTQKDYESIAIAIANNPHQFSKIKNKLLKNLPASALYDTKSFTGHIEAGYQEIYQRHQNDLAPNHLGLPQT